MNILVAGGCGFIGSSLVKRLLIRNHSVTVIDIKDPCNIPVSEESLVYYKMDASSKYCKEVFETGCFDTVAYTAGTTFGKNDIGYGTEFGALANMLNLCVEFNVKNYLYVSTAYLNSYRPISGNHGMKDYPWFDIYCSNKMMGEHYCSAYSRLYNLNVSILRLPQVYGPGQDVYGEGGIVLRALKNLMQKDCLKILAFGNVLELAYIKDISEKIYDLIQSEEHGIYMYRGIHIEADKLISKLKAMIGADKIETVRICDIAIKPPEGIKPLNDIEENTPIDFGLGRTLSWFVNTKNDGLEPAKDKPCVNHNNINYRKSQTNGLFVKALIRLSHSFLKVKYVILEMGNCILTTTRKSYSFLDIKLNRASMRLSVFFKKHIHIPYEKYNTVWPDFKKLLPWIENLALCLFSVLLSGRMGPAIDTRLICILIIGLLYGVLHSVAAAGLCIVFSYSLFMDRYANPFETSILETSVIYFLFAVISGAGSTSKTIEIKKLKDSYGNLESLYTDIRKNLSYKGKAVSILTERVRTSERSFGKVINAIRRLNNRTIEEALLEMPGIVSNITGLDGIALYKVVDEGKRFDLFCSSDQERNMSGIEKILDFKDKIGIKEALNKGNIYINTLQESNVPGVVIPLLNQNNASLAGIITIKHVPFEKLNASTKHMLDFTGEFLSYCFSNSGKYTGKSG